MGFEEHRSPRREHTERFTWLIWRYPLNLSLNSCHFMCIVAHTIIFPGDRRVCLSVWTNENFTIGGYTSGVFPCLLHDILIRQWFVQCLSCHIWMLEMERWEHFPWESQSITGTCEGEKPSLVLCSKKVWEISNLKSLMCLNTKYSEVFWERFR